MMNKQITSLLTLALLATTAVLPGCLPSSVTLSLEPQTLELKEAQVLREDTPISAKIALVDVRGLIADTSPRGPLGSGPNIVDLLIRQLEKAGDDPDVKAVIIRINSPGGTVTASDIIFREIRHFKEKTGKPVVASLGEVAASGGYYIALATDRIVAEPMTITGSIGVIFPGVNVSQGLSRIGVVSSSVVSGPNKGMGDPLSPIEQEHQAILQQLVDEGYAIFKELVVTHRPGLDPAQINRLTDGRVLSGTAALEAGLVDSIGGIRQALAAAKSLAHVEGGARLVKYHTNRDALRPRTAYGRSAPEPAGSSTPAPMSLSPIQIDTHAIGGLGSIEPGRAYYLWIPASP